MISRFYFHFIRYLPKFLFLIIRWVINRNFKRKLYIHIGMPKTGSSAIQALLALNQEFLLINNFSFPRHEGFKQSFQTSAGNVPQMREWIKNNNKKGFGIFVNSSLCKNVILSSEILFSVFKNNPEIFAEFLKGYDYKIICYVRRIDLLTESCLNQGIKNHNLTTYNNFEKVSSEHDYYAAITNSIKYFDENKIIIKPYETKQFVGGNLYSDFLNIFGVSLSSAINYPQKHVNPSLNLDALELRRLFNIIKIDNGDISFKYQLNAILLKYSIANCRLENESILSFDEKRNLLDAYQLKENRLLALFKKKELFKEHLEKITFKTPKNLSIEKIKELLNYIESSDSELFNSLILKIKNSVSLTTETNLLVSVVNNY